MKTTNEPSSFYDFAKPFFDMLTEELNDEGFVDEAEDLKNSFIDPKQHVKDWNDMVLSVPENFPPLSNKKLSTLTATNVKSILRSIDKIETLCSEGEEYFDKLEKLKTKLTNLFLKWLHHLDDQFVNNKLIDPGFVIEIFIDFSLNYEGEFESSLLYCESFLCSHFIRKTWADDDTYLWAPFSLYYFFNFLSIHKFIDNDTFDLAIESLLETKPKFYSFYGRYINPREAESVLEEMMFM